MFFRQLFHFALLAAGWATAEKQHRTGGSYTDSHHGKGQQLDGYYDYIVVGSGSGGGPLACRLARAGFQVLLIEAGDDQGEQTTVRVPTWSLQAGELITQRWDYYVQQFQDLDEARRNEKMCWLTPKGEIYSGYFPPPGSKPLGLLYPRNAALGGCGQHNSLITVCPWEDDWILLQRITGNFSWSPGVMRGYFERLERNSYFPSSVVGHGFRGWLHTTLTPLSLVAQDVKLISMVVAAATALGKGGLLGGVVSTVTGLANILSTDLNAPGRSRDVSENLWQVPIAVNPEYSVRASPRDFLLDTAARFPNLHIQLNTFATRILFDTTGRRPRAYGVAYEVGRSLYQADPRWVGARGVPGYAVATREVIISCGTFETPKLLKNSGIGPADELKHFGIPVIVNLPGVGRNMQDRYEATVITEYSKDFFVTRDCTWGYSLPDPCLERWKNGISPFDRGVYTSNGLALAVTLRSSTTDSEIPDLYISGSPIQFKGYYPGGARETLADARHWTWLILKARSRNNLGTVSLRSTDPFERPQITFNAMAKGEAEDLQALMDGVAWARRANEAVIPLDGDTYSKEVWPGAKVQGPALAQHLKDQTWGHHACCTAKIGDPQDPLAVLDGDFRVYGVDGLRVVDMSIFPKIPGFFAAVPVMMISEKAADAVLGAKVLPWAGNVDAGGLFGTLGAGLVGSVAGISDPNIGPSGLLGLLSSQFGGLGTDNHEPIQKRGVEHMVAHGGSGLK